LNLLSAGAALGLLVLVFQGTWAERLLDFDSTGSIGSRVPLFLFVILFGLSMDYQVFVISRIREAALRGASTRQAVLDGIGSSAGVVTSAAFVMVTVFASFIGLHLIEMKQFGFSLAVAVLLDAFVIRIMILPATMLLLGERSWWPSIGMRRAREQNPAAVVHPAAKVG
ncbi:MMPL family transporter, partial [Streptomyces microflavus]